MKRKNKKAVLSIYFSCKSRIAALLLCILMSLCLSACWSQRELNKLAIVVGAGLDVGDQPDSVKLTAQVVKASEIGAKSASQGAGAGNKAYVNISNTDMSVLSLIRGISHMHNRRLYFSHNKVLIFSSDLAKQNMAEGLDAFTRDHESRMDIFLLVSRNQASEILKEEVEMEKVPALHISGMMENQKTNSETAIITIRDFAIATLSGYTAPVAPMIELYETEGKNKVKLEGTAVFKQGKMIGELDKIQTRGMLWVTDKAQDGTLTVNTQWGQVTLEFTHSKSSLKPVKTKDGTIRMKLTVHEGGTVQNNNTTEDMSRLEKVEMLKKLMEQTIRSDIEQALEQARTLSADVFGFGEAIHRDYPKEWETMKDDWDRLFPQIELDIQVNVELHSTGILVKPVIPGGAK